MQPGGCRLVHAAWRMQPVLAVAAVAVLALCKRGVLGGTTWTELELAWTVRQIALRRLPSLNPNIPDLKHGVFL